MKKILFLSVFFLFIGFVPLVFAADPKGFTALAPIPGLTGPGVTDVVDSKSLADFFNNLYKYLVGLAAVLAVIMIIWGGLEISTQDSISKQSDGKKKIQNAILGLVLVLSPVLVFSIINPRILNLSLNLEPLKTTTGSIAGDGGGGGNVYLDVTNCTANKGPSDGTFLVTCTASAQSTGGQTKSDHESAAAVKVEESLGSMSIDCIGKSDKIWKIVSNVCPVDPVSKVCMKATATAWCSPIVTINVAQQSQSSWPYLLDLAYFGETATFPVSCQSGGWLVRRNEKSGIDSGTGITCPPDNSVIQDIIKKSTGGVCATVSINCQPK